MTTDLRERVLASALASRAPGRPVPTAPDVTPAEATHRQAAALSAVLAGLRPGQWRTRVLRDLDVQGLLGHLVGVEEDLQRALAGDPSVADADHVVSTGAAVARQAGRPPAQTLAEWHAAVAATLQQAAGAGGVLALHGMRLTLDALLVVRAFELWTHENDVRRAVGLPRSRPDEPVLRLMTALAVELLPHAAGQVGTPPLDVHLVLTGPGGGTWDVALGEGDGAGLLLVLDAVDFCRVVADRAAASDVDLHADGPGAADVLRAAAALALD